MRNSYVCIFFTSSKTKFKFIKHSFTIMPDTSLETTETENAKHLGER